MSAALNVQSIWSSLRLTLKWLILTAQTYNVFGLASVPQSVCSIANCLLHCIPILSPLFTALQISIGPNFLRHFSNFQLNWMRDERRGIMRGVISFIIAVLWTEAIMLAIYLVSRVQLLPIHFSWHFNVYRISCAYNLLNKNPKLLDGQTFSDCTLAITYVMFDSLPESIKTFVLQCIWEIGPGYPWIASRSRAVNQRTIWLEFWSLNMKDFAKKSLQKRVSFHKLYLYRRMYWKQW